MFPLNGVWEKASIKVFVKSGDELTTSLEYMQNTKSGTFMIKLTYLTITKSLNVIR